MKHSRHLHPVLCVLPFKRVFQVKSSSRTSCFCRSPLLAFPAFPCSAEAPVWPIKASLLVGAFCILSCMCSARSSDWQTRACQSSPSHSRRASHGCWPQLQRSLSSLSRNGMPCKDNLARCPRDANPGCISAGAAPIGCPVLVNLPCEERDEKHHDIARLLFSCSRENGAGRSCLGLSDLLAIVNLQPSVVVASTGRPLGLPMTRARKGRV